MPPKASRSRPAGRARPAAGTGVDAYRKAAARAMKEIDLRGNIADFCAVLGWKLYWTHRSDRSPAGFPDLVLAHEHGRLLLIELKRDRYHGAKPTVAQLEWLQVLAAIAGHAPTVITVGVWRPIDWLDGTIQAELRRTRPAA